MSSEAVMLDMMSMLTLLNSDKKEEEGELTTLKHLDAGSKVGTFEVEERDGVLIIGIVLDTFLGLILIVVASYFFRKMVLLDHFTDVPNFLAILKFCLQVKYCLQKRKKQTAEKINQPTVMERV